MIQNPSGFTLDLDIIAYIFPMENGSLLLEDGGYIDVGRSLLDTRTLDLSELFVATASLGEDSWLVATTEEEDFTLGFLGGDVFSCDEVDGAETDHEDPEDTEVSTTVSRVPIWDDVSDLPPLVGCIVLVGLFNISSTFNNSQAWDSTNSRADSLQRRHILVPRSTWDERCRETGIVLADELIDHKSREAISDRVKIIDPSSPASHIRNRKSETCIDDDRQNQHGSWSHCLRQGTRNRCDGTEQHRHDHGQHEGYQDEEEEVSRLSIQVDHEVERCVEDDGVEDFVRHVCQHGRDSFT